MWLVCYRNRGSLINTCGRYMCGKIFITYFLNTRDTRGQRMSNIPTIYTCNILFLGIKHTPFEQEKFKSLCLKMTNQCSMWLSRCQSPIVIGFIFIITKYIGSTDTFTYCYQWSFASPSSSEMWQNYKL